MLALCLGACAKDPPKSCRERVASYIADVYTNPADLNLALNAVCQETP